MASIFSQNHINITLNTLQGRPSDIGVVGLPTPDPSPLPQQITTPLDQTTMILAFW